MNLDEYSVMCLSPKHPSIVLRLEAKTSLYANGLWLWQRLDFSTRTLRARDKFIEFSNLQHSNFWNQEHCCLKLKSRVYNWMEYNQFSVQACIDGSVSQKSMLSSVRSGMLYIQINQSVWKGIIGHNCLYDNLSLYVTNT